MYGRICTRQLSNFFPFLSMTAAGGNVWCVDSKLCMARAICFRLFDEFNRAAAFRTFCTAGSARPAEAIASAVYWLAHSGIVSVTPTVFPTTVSGGSARNSSRMFSPPRPASPMTASGSSSSGRDPAPFRRPANACSACLRIGSSVCRPISASFRRAFPPAAASCAVGKSSAHWRTVSFVTLPVTMSRSAAISGARSGATSFNSAALNGRRAGFSANVSWFLAATARAGFSGPSFLPASSRKAGSILASEKTSVRSSAKWTAMPDLSSARYVFPPAFFWAALPRYAAVTFAAS